MLEPTAGRVIHAGDDITSSPVEDRVRRGIVLAPGGRGVFPSLTVDENLRLAAWLKRHDPTFIADTRSRIFELFPALEDRLDSNASLLSGGEQQMLTLAQALLCDPKVLMIDELSLGLAPAVVEQLLGIVRDISAAGTTIIIVEQSVNVALSVAERAVFMEKGEIRFSGPTEDLLARPDILHSVYLQGAGGGSVKARARRQVLDTDPVPVLEVRGATKSFGGITAVNGVDLTLADGQILGLIGPNGAGKTTLFDLISGFVPMDAGEISLAGETVTELSPDARSRAGLARSFQDARLFPSLTVEENIAVALERHLTSTSTITDTTRTTT
jgi:branched-chain amino acid transport system ATP-binding protein